MDSGLESTINEDHLTCQICLLSFTKPKALPCLHTFCESCLELYVNRDGHQQEDALSCPTCRNKIKIPENGVAGFPTNHLVTSLQHTLTSRTGPHGDVSYGGGKRLHLGNTLPGQPADRLVSPRGERDRALGPLVQLKQQKFVQPKDVWTVDAQPSPPLERKPARQLDPKLAVQLVRKSALQLVRKPAPRLKQKPAPRLKPTPAAQLEQKPAPLYPLQSARPLNKGYGILKSSQRLQTLSVQRQFLSLNDDEDGKEIMELSVPGELVGHIIGSQGSRIKKIARTSGAHLTFFKNANWTQKGDLEVLKITGTQASIDKARQIVQEIVDDVREIQSETMDVPGFAMGRIIGRGGSTIQAIQAVTGAKIITPKLCNVTTDSSSVHSFSIHGNRHQILKAKDNMVNTTVIRLRFHENDDSVEIEKILINFTPISPVSKPDHVSILRKAQTAFTSPRKIDYDNLFDMYDMPGFADYDNVVEIYDMPGEFVTEDLCNAFPSFMSSEFEVKWVADKRALVIFSSPEAVQKALTHHDSNIKVRKVIDPELYTKRKAKQCVAKEIAPISRETIIEMTVPDKIVGIVIGKGGSRIKQMAQVTKTQLHFTNLKPKKSEPSDAADITDEPATLVIRGSDAAAEQALEMAQKIIQQFNVISNNQENDKIKITKQSIIEVNIPQKSMRNVTGRKWSSIQQVEAKSHTKIHLNIARQRSSTGELVHRLVIRGTLTATLLAEKLIQELKDAVHIEMSISVEIIRQIIGLTGDANCNIQDICRLSIEHAKISVSTGGDEKNLTTIKRITISGKEDDTNRLKELLETLVNDAQQDIKTVSAVAADSAAAADLAGQDSEDDFIECECCFDDEVRFQEMGTCGNGHLFCQSCIQRSCEVVIGQGKVEFPCLAGDCEMTFSTQELRAILPERLRESVLHIMQTEEIRQADISDLVHCPHCSFGIIMPNKTDTVLKCLNPECHKETCRLCKEPNHCPLRCDQVENQGETSMRAYVENKMSEAMLRKCYKCAKSFYKLEGCNKMECPCGAKMCYVCRAPITGYEHFERSGGCPLTSDEDQLHTTEISTAGQQAKETYRQTHPDLAGVTLKNDPLASLRW